jgi:hypothetical protein
VTPAPVLYLLTTWVTGGTETQLLLLLRELDRRRFRPLVCALYPDPRVQQVMAAIDLASMSDNSGIRPPRPGCSRWPGCVAANGCR